MLIEKLSARWMSAFFMHLFTSREYRQRELAKVELRSANRVAIAIFVSALVVCCAFASAQSSAGAGSLQDPNAVSAVNLALTSMGGTSSFTSIQDTTVTGQASAGSPPNSVGQITWMTIGMSIRCATVPPTGNSIYTDQNGAGYVEDASGNVAPMDSRLALTLFPFHLPGAVLLNLLNAANETLSVVADTGSTPNIVHVRSLVQMSDPTLTPVTQQDWYVDMNTGLPTRVDYYLPNITNSALDGTATILFTSWQKTPTILVPQTIQMLTNGTQVSTVTLGIPQFNQGLSATIFQLP